MNEMEFNLIGKARFKLMSFVKTWKYTPGKMEILLKDGIIKTSVDKKKSALSY